MKFGNSVMNKLKAREFHFVRFSDVVDLWAEGKKKDASFLSIQHCLLNNISMRTPTPLNSQLTLFSDLEKKKAYVYGLRNETFLVPTRITQFIPYLTAPFFKHDKSVNLGRIYLYECYPSQVAPKYSQFISLSSLKPLNKHLCALICHSQEIRKKLNTCKK